uniref:Fungal lipase-type domain-containing protein n=1 Tax=Nelumbo nucifera TaxID=4432 RepID=A0A822XK96_NELNU|nr:TPA_asm: hypothetical protein HUJ06_020698 [Nelumbo nucifera]
MFCDRPKNVRLLLVAFRGTEIANAADWLTDLDVVKLEEFIKQNQGKDVHCKENLAYYTIREELRRLLLGGALATQFVAGLAYHKEDDILNNLVGDKNFGKFMEEKLNRDYTRYFRVVYRYDIVPRLPFGNPVTEFVHFGGCLYYSSWYKAQDLKEETNENYFNPLYFIPMHFNACLHFVRAIFVGIKEGKSFNEGFPSLFVRALGLLVPGMSSHSPRYYINGASCNLSILVRLFYSK